MEDFKNNNFEQFLRSATDDFLMVPSKKVWYSIYNDLHPDRKWPSLAVCLFILCAVLYIGISNNNSLGNAARKASEENLQVIAKNYAKGNEINYMNPSATLATISKVKAAKKYLSLDLNENPYENTIAEIIQTVPADKVNDQLAEQNDNILFSEYDNINKPITTSKDKNIEIKNTFSNEDAAKSIITAAIEFPRSNKISKSKYKQNTIEENILVKITAPEEEPDNITSAKFTTENVTQDSHIIKNTIAQKVALSKTIANEEIALQEQNKNLRKAAARTKFKRNSSLSYYMTPSLGYRLINMRDGFKPSASYTQLSLAALQSVSLRDAPSLSLEAGAVFNYAIAKRLRIKTGLQFNYINYTTSGTKLPHPTQASVAVLNNNTAMIRGSEFSTDGNQTKFNHTSLQLSVPVGADFILVNGRRVKWYVGTSVQPTYNFGGNSLLMSADQKNLIRESSLKRNFNINIAAETFVSIGLKGGFSLNLGPQFRYQALSTYKKPYGYKENLITTGLKVGFTKGF